MLTTQLEICDVLELQTLGFVLCVCVHARVCAPAHADTIIRALLWPFNCILLLMECKWSHVVVKCIQLNKDCSLEVLLQSVHHKKKKYF